MGKEWDEVEEDRPPRQDTGGGGDINSPLTRFQQIFKSRGKKAFTRDKMGQNWFMPD
jgi:hypothetical protein